MDFPGLGLPPLRRLCIWPTVESAEPQKRAGWPFLRLKGVGSGGFAAAEAQTQHAQTQEGQGSGFGDCIARAVCIAVDL